MCVDKGGEKGWDDVEERKRERVREREMKRTEGVRLLGSRVDG